MPMSVSISHFFHVCTYVIVQIDLEEAEAVRDLLLDVEYDLIQFNAV